MSDDNKNQSLMFDMIQGQKEMFDMLQEQKDVINKQNAYIKELLEKDERTGAQLANHATKTEAQLKELIDAQTFKVSTKTDGRRIDSVSHHAYKVAARLDEEDTVRAPLLNAALGNDISGPGKGIEWANALKAIDWFEQTFNAESFSDLTPLQILDKFQLWGHTTIRNKTLAPNTVSSRLRSLDLAFKWFQIPTDERYETLYSTFLGFVNKQISLAKARDEYIGGVPLTDADMVHIINTCLEKAPIKGILPMKQLRSILQLQISRCTSRRPIESHFIPAASIKLEFTPKGARGSDITHRKILFETPWEKGLGTTPTGIASSCQFVQNPRHGLQHDCVGLTLLYLAKLGYIKRSEVMDIYNNKIPLHLLPDVFETIEDIVACLEKAKDRLMARLTEKSKKYKVGQQAKFANVYDFMEKMSLVDDDDLTSGQGGCHDEFWKLVQVFRKEHGKKVLFDQNYHQRQDDIRHLGRHTGYLPRRSACFCTNGARKYAVNCAANRTVSASVTQVDTILGNDERTRKNSYVRKQDLRRNIPNNQFQVGVTDQDVQALLDGKEPCQPAFLFKGFFQKEFKLMDEMPLPAVAVFLESQLEHITDVELTFGCFVVGCGNKFSNIQELVSHTRNECKFRTSTIELTTRGNITSAPNILQ